jgi:hypothetical protein
MPSRVIYGRDFNVALDQGLAPEQFKYRFLVEGDSWMDRSAPTQASLPWSLANRFDAADPGHRQIHDDDVGAHFGVALVGRFATVRFVDDFDVGRGIEQHAKSHAHDRMIVDQHDADFRHGHGKCGPVGLLSVDGYEG